MKKIMFGNTKVIILFIICFICIRSLHFPDYLNFSADQGLASLRALELWQNKELTFIGPPTSFNFEGRSIFHGSISYYTQLFFLLLGNFDPLVASYLFMITSALALIPLYFGMLYLKDKKAAILLCMIYSLAPFYIDYTRFLWNPTFQLSITPVLIYFLGLWRKTKSDRYAFFSGIICGLLFLYHYQFAIGILFLFILFSYYTFKLRNFYLMFFFLLGLLIGSSPFLISELKTNFYTLTTAKFFFEHRSEMTGDSNLLVPHYYLSLSILFGAFIISAISNFLNKKLILISGLILFLYTLSIYIKVPTHGFGMVEDWNYPSEQKAYQIITSQNISNYNVVNLGYETLASVQKYLHAKDNNKFEFNNYQTNEYLYVITNKENYLQDPSYEVSSFQNPQIINKWPINKTFNLYLLKRGITNADNVQ